MDDAESAKRSFVCKGCGANLNFTPGLQSLKCEFCGTVSQLIADYDHIPDLEKVSLVVPMKAEEYQLQLAAFENMAKGQFTPDDMIETARFREIRRILCPVLSFFGSL